MRSSIFFFILGREFTRCGNLRQYIFVVLEKSSRMKKKYYQIQGTVLKKAPKRLEVRYGYFAFLACAIPFTIGFLIPFFFHCSMYGKNF